MKKQFIVIVTGLCLLLAVTATQSVAQVKFGPIGGLNMSDVTGDADSDGMAIGFHIGGLFNFGITDALMIEPQVLYSTKGAKGSDENLTLNYVEIPIWVRYQLGGGLNFNAGPYIGVLVGAKVGDEDVKDAYTGTDFGIGFGVGYQLEGGLGIGLNYNIGMANIGEDIDLGPLGTYEYKAKNSNIKLSLSYTLGGRRE